MSRAFLVAVLALLAAASCLGEEGAELDEDFVTPEEQATREMERRRGAPPVLECTPGRLEAALSPDQTKTLRLTIRNAGGLELSWSFVSGPTWAQPSARGGKLGFEGEEGLLLAVVPTGLEAGKAHRGEITIEAPGAAHSPVTIPVILEVTSPAVTAAKPEVEVVREAEGEGERDLPGPEAVEEAPGRTKRRGLGVRLGYSLPIGGAPAFTGGLSGGLYYRAAPKSGRLGFEFGMDCGLSESDSGAVKSTLLMGHAEAVLNLSRTGSPYVLGGGKFVVEQTSDAAYDTDDTIVGGAIDVGAGVTLSSGKVDIRALYSFLLQSENIAGVASVALGYAF